MESESNTIISLTKGKTQIAFYTPQSSISNAKKLKSDFVTTIPQIRSQTASIFMFKCGTKRNTIARKIKLKKSRLEQFQFIAYTTSHQQITKLMTYVVDIYVELLKIK